MVKKVKIISFIILVIILLISTSRAFAAGILAPGDYDGDKSNVNVDEIVNVGNQIVTAIKIVGTILSVGMLIVLGIKFMMASPEGKANFKGAMMPYIVGAILLFASTWIATSIYEAVASTKPTTGVETTGTGSPTHILPNKPNK